jgi:hypothetical protein
MVQLAAAPVWVPAPLETPQRRSQPVIAAWVIRIWEADPPAGVEPLEWVLICSLPTRTLDELKDRRDWYGSLQKFCNTAAEIQAVDEVLVKWTPFFGPISCRYKVGVRGAVGLASVASEADRPSHPGTPLRGELPGDWLLRAACCWHTRD